MKGWINTHKKIIKMKAQISFLKNYKKWGIILPHLEHVKNLKNYIIQSKI